MDVERVINYSIGAVGLLLDIIGIAATFRTSRKHPLPLSRMRATKLLAAPGPDLLAENDPQLKITYGDVPVSRIYRVDLAFWNAGNVAWDYDKLVDEFAVMLNKGQQVLRPPLVHETRPGVVQFRAEPGGNNDKVKLSFKVMQPGDGVLLRLLVGFPFSQLPSNDSDLDVKGVFTDVPKNGAVRSDGRLVLQEPITFRQQCESLAARVLASGLLLLS